MLNWGPSMQIRVVLEWIVGCAWDEEVEVRMDVEEVGERARWIREERRGSKGWAMEMWPTMPESKNVQGRTCGGRC